MPKTDGHPPPPNDPARSQTHVGQKPMDTPPNETHVGQKQMDTPPSLTTQRDPKPM